MLDFDTANIRELSLNFIVKATWVDFSVSYNASSRHHSLFQVPIMCQWLPAKQKTRAASCPEHTRLSITDRLCALFLVRYAWEF